MLIIGLIAVAVIGGISLVAFQFFPGTEIQMGTGDIRKILTQGGGGLLITILGAILIHGGVKAILSGRATVEDDWGRHQEKRTQCGKTRGSSFGYCFGRCDHGFLP